MLRVLRACVPIVPDYFSFLVVAWIDRYYGSYIVVHGGAPAW